MTIRMAARDEADRSALRVDEGAPTTSQVVSSKASTSPAPPDVAPDSRTDVPSARPTSVPDYNVAAVARGALPFEPHPNVPEAIPRRVPGADATVLPHAGAYVLMHVDGVSSIKTISEVADLPLEEVMMYFLELAALGIVTMNERRPLESMPPDSHVHRKRRDG